MLAQILDLPVSRMWETSFYCLEAPRLWYFVSVAQTKTIPPWKEEYCLVLAILIEGRDALPLKWTKAGSVHLFLLWSLCPLSFSSLLSLPFPSSFLLLTHSRSICRKPGWLPAGPCASGRWKCTWYGSHHQQLPCRDTWKVNNKKQHAPAKVQLAYRAEFLLPTWLCKIPDDFLLLTLEWGSHSRVILWLKEGDPFAVCEVQGLYSLGHQV